MTTAPKHFQRTSRKILRDGIKQSSRAPAKTPEQAAEKAEMLAKLAERLAEESAADDEETPATVKGFYVLPEFAT